MSKLTTSASVGIGTVLSIAGAIVVAGVLVGAVVVWAVPRG